MAIMLLRRRDIPRTMLILLALGWFVSTILYVRSVNGCFSFPLDDPWIHLQFARNLHDYGRFSYFQADNVTSGSTSPLYTIILAAGFAFTSNEFILCYVLGILFLLSSAWLLFAIILQDGDRNALPAAAGMLLLLAEPRLLWIALSGMETTLFLALLLGTWYAYQKRRQIILGVSAGLLIWTRPEAVLFLSALAADALWNNLIKERELPAIADRSSPNQRLAWMKRSALIAAAFALLYMLFNVILSGSLLPNTFAAKLKYYSSTGLNFPGQAFRHFAGGHMRLASVFASIAVIDLFVSLVRKRRSPVIVPAFWSLALFLAYWRSLPYLFQEGRYLMPIMPFLIFLSVKGVVIVVGTMSRAFRLPARSRFAFAAMAVCCALMIWPFVVAALGMRDKYAVNCKFIGEHQIRTARWIHNNLPDQAVIATHDIGAMAFYSGHRIVDMMGLVTPKMIDTIGRLDDLPRYLESSRVTHIACLRYWFAISNQNPIFQADARTLDVMEVYEFDERQTHFMPRNAYSLVELARDRLNARDFAQATQLLERAIALDPTAAHARYWSACALVLAKRLDEAMLQVQCALQIQPTYWDARLLEAYILMQKSLPLDAMRRLQDLLAANPDAVEAYDLLANCYEASGIDRQKEQYYREEYSKRKSKLTP